MDKYAGLNNADIDSLKQCLKKEAECRDLWIRAIRFTPQLAAHCRRWSEFTTLEWVRLITDNIQFAGIAPLHKFSYIEWCFLLEEQPSLIDRCPVIDKIPEMLWGELVKKQPHLKKYRTNSQTEKQQ